MFDRPPVASSADFVRVRNLQVRGLEWYPADLPQRLSRLLRDFSSCDGAKVDPRGLCAKCGQPFELRELQARALYDAGTYHRAFLPLRVGAGKTLVGFLLPRVIECRQPVILVPAALMEKTNREWHALAKHWKVARHIKFRSYQALGRASGSDQLDKDQPDLIIADECHFLKNPKAAVTRRVARYMHGHPQTIFVPMSGTIMKASIKDFSHLMEWSHRSESCLPLIDKVLGEWADALDEGANPMARRSPGVLLDLFPAPPGASEEPFQRARQIFFARSQACAGVVSSDARQDYDGSLYISALEYTPNAKTDENFARLRQLMERPDGWTLSEAMQVWAVARMLALGLHYEWLPSAPQEWLDARKHWAKYARKVLEAPWSKAAGLDTELQVRHAVMGGRLEDEYGVLAEWRRISPEFSANSVPVWHDDTALNVCAEWMGKHKTGVVFVDHRFFGMELARRTGTPYYGAQGLDANDNFIEAHPRGTPAVASRRANTTGRNIQGIFSDMLVAAPPADSEAWEQMLGRLHRQGQPADSVSVDVLVGCREHLESIPRGVRSSDVKQDLLGFTQKLRLADIDWPQDSARDRAGSPGAEVWRWA